MGVQEGIRLHLILSPRAKHNEHEAWEARRALATRFEFRLLFMTPVLNYHPLRCSCTLNNIENYPLLQAGKDR